MVAVRGEDTQGATQGNWKLDGVQVKARYKERHRTRAQSQMSHLSQHLRAHFSEGKMDEIIDVIRKIHNGKGLPV